MEQPSSMRSRSNNVGARPGSGPPSGGRGLLASAPGPCGLTRPPLASRAMKRRELLGAAVLAALPWRRLRAEPGWRTFEVTTRAEISRPEGVSRAWLPLPLATATDWQRTLGSTWNGNAKRMEEVRVGKYGVSMLYAEWAAGTEAPFVELKSKFSTRDRAVDFARPGGAALTGD